MAAAPHPPATPTPPRPARSGTERRQRRPGARGPAGHTAEAPRPAHAMLRFARARCAGKPPEVLRTWAVGLGAGRAERFLAAVRQTETVGGRADTSCSGDRRVRLLRNTGGAPRNGGGPARQRRPARRLAEAAATPLPRDSRPGPGPRRRPAAGSHDGAARG